MVAVLAGHASVLIAILTGEPMLRGATLTLHLDGVIEPTIAAFRALDVKRRQRRLLTLPVDKIKRPNRLQISGLTLFAEAENFRATCTLFSEIIVIFLAIREHNVEGILPTLTFVLFSVPLEALFSVAGTSICFWV